MGMDLVVSPCVIDISKVSIPADLPQRTPGLALLGDVMDRGCVELWLHLEALGIDPGPVFRRN